ncbi:MAG: hypothetical protein V4717_10750, partial [Bacteroidota bacterium]
HCITPILLQQDRLGLTTSRVGLAAHTIDVLCQLPRGGFFVPNNQLIPQRSTRFSNEQNNKAPVETGAD